MLKERSDENAVITNDGDSYAKKTITIEAGAEVIAELRALEVVKIIREVEAPIAGQDLTHHHLKGNLGINNEDMDEVLSLKNLITHHSELHPRILTVSPSVCQSPHPAKFS